MIYAQRATKEYSLWVEGTAHYQLTRPRSYLARLLYGHGLLGGHDPPVEVNRISRDHLALSCVASLMAVGDGQGAGRSIL